MGIVLAILVTANVRLIDDAPGYKWLGGLVILFLAWYLIADSLKALKGGPSSPAAGPEAAAE
jgi:hypothetical protein